MPHRLRRAANQVQAESTTTTDQAARPAKPRAKPAAAKAKVQRQAAKPAAAKKPAKRKSR